MRRSEDLAFPAGVRDVLVRRESKKRVIVPANAAWDDFFDQPGIDLGERAARA